MKAKLWFGLFFLFTGFLSLIGIGLLLMHFWDEYKLMQAKNVTNNNTDRYISTDVVEEFR